MNRRHAALTLATIAAGSYAHAQPSVPVDGAQYSTLRDTQPPSTPGKIDVVEFFSYGCPACNAFEPALESWAARLPSDVVFRRVPVPFFANAENFQRTFFALEATGMSQRIHGRIFEAVHVKKQRLVKPDEIAEVVASAGGDRAKFLSAFNAFSMGAFLARAKSATSSYRIDQIPTLALAGRYTTSPAQAGGAREALAVSDFLIQKARRA